MSLSADYRQPSSPNTLSAELRAMGSGHLVRRASVRMCSPSNSFLQIALRQSTIRSNFTVSVHSLSAPQQGISQRAATAALGIIAAQLGKGCMASGWQAYCQIIASILFRRHHEHEGLRQLWPATQPNLGCFSLVRCALEPLSPTLFGDLYCFDLCSHEYSSAGVKCQA